METDHQQSKNLDCVMEQNLVSRSILVKYLCQYFCNGTVFQCWCVLACVVAFPCFGQSPVTPSSRELLAQIERMRIERIRAEGRLDTTYLRLLLSAVEDLNLPHMAPKFLNEARKILPRVENPILGADFLLAAGLVARAEGRYVAAADTMRLALDRYIALGDKPKTAHTYSRLGLLYHQLGQYEAAIIFHLDALEAAREIGYTEIVFRQEINIAHLLSVFGKPERALGLLNHAETIIPPNVPVQRLVALYQYKAEALLQQGNFEASSVELQKALNFSWGAEYRDTLVIAFLCGDMAHLLQKQGQSSQAQKMMDSALTLQSSLGFSHDNVRLSVEAARVMLIRATQEKDGARKRELYRAVIAYGEPALQNKSVVLMFRLWLKQILAEAYAALGDFQAAYGIERRYILLRDSLLNIGLEGQITAVEERLQRNKRELEIDRLRMDKTAQTQLQWALVAVAVILVAFVLVLWNRFRLKKRSESLVAAMNKNLQTTNTQLQTANMLLNRANADLSLANKYAEEVADMKQAFVEMLSHEIRTPLTAIQGYSEILLWDAQEPQQREFADNIRTSVRHLLLLFEDMLHLAKMRTDQITLDIHPVSLRELCQQVCAIYESAAKEKGIALGCDIGTSIVQYVMLDEAKVRLILVNLLGNAVKFTREGSVMLAVALTKNEKNTESTEIPSSITLTVKDTGIGISADALPHIFDSFQHTDVETYRKYGGLGLGLTICKSFVDTMGGEIHVTSTEGVGTEFRVVLPFEEAYSVSE
jgi:signal transduction histidine kinase